MPKLLRLSLPILSAGLILAWSSRSHGQGLGQDGIPEAVRRHRPGQSRRAARAPEPEELRGRGINSSVFLRDLVVSNTDANLFKRDTEQDTECSIAIDPTNPQRIVVSAFSGDSGPNGGFAPLWHSEDGGATWTKSFNLPEPPPTPHAIPFDQTFDYSPHGVLFGTVLSVTDGMFNSLNSFSGSTVDPAANAWQWFLEDGAAQATSHLFGFDTIDQPWTLTGPDPLNPAQDNVYAAYLNYPADHRDPDARAKRPSTSQPWSVRVATAYDVGAGPPNFTVDTQVAQTPLDVHPGQRLAVDPRNGALYSLYAREVKELVKGDVYLVDYMVNRSLDAGRTWGLNGQAEGIPVYRGGNIQTSKLGGVNLPGNEHHGAVDPSTGDLYVAFGDRNPSNHRLQLRAARLTAGAGDQLVRKSVVLVSKAHVAMPQVAVTASGVVGVFYYTFDGKNGRNYPLFSAHLAVSQDRGLTWQDILLQTFLSAEKNDRSDGRQRVLGDYQQLKALGETFYGAYTANGIQFGRSFANHDPIFFKLPWARTAAPRR